VVQAVKKPSRLMPKLEYTVENQYIKHHPIKQD